MVRGWVKISKSLPPSNLRTAWWWGLVKVLHSTNPKQNPEVRCWGTFCRQRNGSHRNRLLVDIASNKSCPSQSWRPTEHLWSLFFWDSLRHEAYKRQQGGNIGRSPSTAAVQKYPKVLSLDIHQHRPKRRKNVKWDLPTWQRQQSCRCKKLQLLLHALIFNHPSSNPKTYVIIKCCL